MICRKKLGKISYGDVKKMRRVLAEVEAEAEDDDANVYNCNYSHDKSE